VIDVPSQDPVGVRSAARRTAWAATACLAGGVDDRDPLNGDSLPRSLGEVLRSARRASASGRNPLPSDGLQQLVEFVLQPLREVIERPRARIERSHAMMPLHRIRDLDAKCTEWVGRQPGRTVREKLAGKPSILGVRREFTAETNENILVAKLLRGLLPRVDERLRMVSAGAFDLVDEARHEALLGFQRMCVRALRGSEFGEIDHRKPVRPNNVLLGDRRYVKLWRGWRWLRELDAGERTRIASAPALFMQALFAATCAEIAGGTGAVFSDAVLRVPSESVDDAGRICVDSLQHAGDRFVWRSWRTVEFLSTQQDSVFFDRVSLDASALSIARRGAAGCAVLRADEQVQQTVCSVDFTSDPRNGEGGLGVRCTVGFEDLFEGPADLEAIRTIATQLLRAHGFEHHGEPHDATGSDRNDAAEAVGIDLGSTCIATSPLAAGSERRFARFAVGLSAVASQSPNPELQWLLGSTDTTPDPMRRGVKLVSINDLLAEGETLEPAIQSGAARIFSGLRSELDRAGIGPSVSKAVIVPDSKGELAQSALRRLSIGAIGKSVHVSRTSCLATGWQRQDAFSNKLSPDDVLVVVDARSDGLAVAFLQAKHDAELSEARDSTRGIHWERRPAFIASDLDPRLAALMRQASWRAALIEYARRVMDLSPFDPQLESHQLQEVAERLTDMGHVEQVLCTGAPAQVLLGEAEGWSIRLPYDRSTARAVIAEFVQHLQAALEGVFQNPLAERVRRDLSVDAKHWHLLLADLPGLHGEESAASVLEKSDIDSMKGRLKSRLQLSGVYVTLQARSLASMGAVEMLEREAEGLPSVVDWLPPLSLEVMDDGGYREFIMLEDAVTSPLRTSTVDTFEVKQRLLLPPGVQRIEFPLFEGRAMRQDREVCLESDSFPLGEPLKIAMKVLYRHGEEQPYELIVEPVDQRLKHPIRATIGAPKPRMELVPHYPPPRGWMDPWVTERISWTVQHSGRWVRRLEDLKTRGASLDSAGLRTDFVPVLREIYMNVRSIWGDGRLLGTAPDQTRASLVRAVPFDWIMRLAALDADAKLKLESRITDHTVRHQLRRWSRRILGAMHSERAQVLLPVILEEASSKLTTEHVELFGQLVGDGREERAACLQHLIEAARGALKTGRKGGMGRSTILALGEACWRHRDFVPTLYSAAPDLVDMYLEQATTFIEECCAQCVKDPQNAIQHLGPQCIRAIGETTLAFLRLRDAIKPPAATRAGSPLLTRLGIAFCQAERELSELRGGTGAKQRALRLNSYLRFEFDRDPRLNQTSDLAFVLRHYLNGGSGPMIEIIGRSEGEEDE
jgi:hypothetical protein